MNTQHPLSLSGMAVLDDGVLNSGTAFTEAERREHFLEGLLPAIVETIERQLERIMDIQRRSPLIWKNMSTSSGFATA